MVDPKQDIQQILRILSQKPELTAATLSALKGMVDTRYGDVHIKMENGKPVWVDCVKRERVG